MRHLLAGIALLLIPVVLEAQSPAPPAKPTPAASPAAPGDAADKHNLVGTVVSVDAAQSTLTFKDPKGQTLTWKAEGKATGRLKGLKAGQKIKIGYSVDEKGAPKAATSIRHVGKGKKSEAM
jgi:hypothetical protein